MPEIRQRDYLAQLFHLLSDESLPTAEEIVKLIEESKVGLDPQLLANWYAIIEHKVDEACPEALKGLLKIEQDPVLWMKFRIRISKRVVPYFITAVEVLLPDMPFATSLYFQKVESILEDEMRKDSSIEP